MKHTISIILITTLLLTLNGCGQSKVIDGTLRKPVGLISMNATNTGNYSNKVQYEPCWGNIFWAIILIETIIAPIYFFGFSMFNPIGPNNPTN